MVWVPGFLRRRFKRFDRRKGKERRDRSRPVLVEDGKYSFPDGEDGITEGVDRRSGKDRRKNP